MKTKCKHTFKPVSCEVSGFFNKCIINTHYCTKCGVRLDELKPQPARFSL